MHRMNAMQILIHYILYHPRFHPKTSLLHFPAQIRNLKDDNWLKNCFEDNKVDLPAMLNGACPYPIISAPIHNVMNTQRNECK